MVREGSSISYTNVVSLYCICQTNISRFSLKTYRPITTFENGTLDNLATGNFSSLKAIHKVLFENVYLPNIIIVAILFVVKKNDFF